MVGGEHGDQVCQHRCPVAHVAEQFPELCDAEREVFGQLLGTHVTRLATLAAGDGVCTTLVPRPPGGPESRSTSTADTRTSTGSTTAPSASRKDIA